MFQCCSQIIPPLPSPTESKSLFFKSVSPLLPTLHVGLLVLSFYISYICVNIQYLSFSFWLTSLCIIGSRFIHLLELTQMHFFIAECQSPAPVARGSTWRDERCQRETRQPLSFLGLPIYFKLKILFYTFTKALGQRFDIFSSPWPRFFVSINHRCPSKGVPASAIFLSTSSHVSLWIHCNSW